MVTSPHSFGWKASLLLVCLTVLIGYKLDWDTLPTISNSVVMESESSRSSRTFVGNIFYPAAPRDTMLLHPGELPGYTGWARPEHTLAEFFSIVHVSSHFPTVGQPLIITVQCQGHDDCQKDSSLFFLRAYGPAVVPGIVNDVDRGRGKGVYNLQFTFHDPGQYTVEAVLTFSTAPPNSAFPVPEEAQQPAYEGYLLPEFPLIVHVAPATRTHGVKQQSGIDSISSGDNLCTIRDMVTTSNTDAIQNARWVVTGKSNNPGYYVSNVANNAITKRGYAEGVNSLGVQMEYQHLSNCELLPESAFDRNLHDQRVFAHCLKNTSKTLRIIYIGDSVLRVQKDKLRQLTNRMSNLEFHFLLLHFGYRRNQVLGPSNVTAFLNDLQDRYPNDPKAILFNTGLHDIHQLCGAENAEDRKTYLDPKRLHSGAFSCTNEYRALLQEFVTRVQEFPAQLKVFQTTTAAWPKYGNWGIGWEANAQNMPLVSDFSHAFNDIAVGVLNERNGKTSAAAAAKDAERIHMMDAYWMTYARPDNREIGDIGKKLSHPGDEVLSVMARMWSKMILDDVC
jgi:hypothetical protein